ncbi:YidH family protein [Solimonas terrae]|uniref:DUF202 domain-containing protein n=1 Tax=Solimonas terrae TaxID=1396819 RepID=A0A6M2BQM6_9GAMM|nr:DUF202 domain-containing protein [Solimonas terrae]NGY04373.1 DUF202 domain-containing protein [Solimonas terrae]
MNDPRVFFAAERTLFAWLRTGLTIIALGFVVQRFGLVLRLFALDHPAAITLPGAVRPSAALGVALVLLGSITILIGAWQHRAYVRSLPRDALPPGYRSEAAIVIAVLVAIAGLMLGGYLAL